MSGLFQKATKKAAKLRMAIVGPSGSGKTYTALTIATALMNGKPIAVVDTEHGSASKYAGNFDFDVAEMTAPYKPDKYVTAIKEAASAGYGVIILDSLTHGWNGEGGLLDIVDNIAKAKYRGNTFAAWKDATPIQKALIDAMLSSDIHVIATMRSKTEYIIEEDERGRKTPKKVGMAPEQRQGLEYEYDVVLEMSIDNTGVVTKTRCSELREHNEGVFPKPGADLASILREWLSGDKPESEPAPSSNGASNPKSEYETGPDNTDGFAAGAVEEETYYRHAWNQLTGKPYDLVKWVATLHSRSDKKCTVKQYGYLVSIMDELSDKEHGYILSVLCQDEIDKSNRPGAKVANELLKILPATAKDDDGEEVENSDHRADIAQIFREIAAQGKDEAVLAGVDDEEDIPY